MTRPIPVTRSPRHGQTHSGSPGGDTQGGWRDPERYRLWIGGRTRSSAKPCQSGAWAHPAIRVCSAVRSLTVGVDVDAALRQCPDVVILQLAIDRVSADHYELEVLRRVRTDQRLEVSDGVVADHEIAE